MFAEAIYQSSYLPRVLLKQLRLQDSSAAHFTSFTNMSVGLRPGLILFFILFFYSSLTTATVFPFSTFLEQQSAPEFFFSTSSSGRLNMPLMWCDVRRWVSRSALCDGQVGCRGCGLSSDCLATAAPSPSNQIIAAAGQKRHRRTFQHPKNNYKLIAVLDYLILAQSEAFSSVKLFSFVPGE